MKIPKSILVFLILIQTVNCYAQGKSSKAVSFFSNSPLSIFENIDYLKSELGFSVHTGDKEEIDPFIKSDRREKLVLQKDAVILEYREFEEFYIVRADVTSQTDFIPWSALIGKTNNEVIHVLGISDTTNESNHSEMYFLNYLYTAVIYYENNVVVKIRVAENS